ncbi:UvrD-helicase domain-containing protein [Sphingobacterium kitahiroshimense]|uniref:UvrD-helicase domain-containing protein n=1 Tax=Sphingobacterium sp. B16(2022) TaxID=2914044 RepID=UPI0014388B82|nr:UvrD-helicase domain-containing protein [Sphingobacterium sp. B16(2022)]NJI72294.1 UvrD-helicase domain-containing protein [Sphingobacterium sp. B16(2022)]
MPEFRFLLPAIGSLYNDQQLAYNPRHSVLVTGGPGSGKTVVTIFRFLRAVMEEQDIMLFTFHNTLIYTIRGMLKERAEELFGELDEARINDIVENKLATFFKWHYTNIKFFNDQEETDEMRENFRSYILEKRNERKFDELFYDEGQDLPKNVYSNTFELSDIITVGADRAQNYREYYPTDEVEDIILESLQEQIEIDPFYLGGNHRNTRQIFDLAKKFVTDDLRVQGMDSSILRAGNNPEIQTTFNEQQQLDYIRQIIENNPNSNIGILVHFRRNVNRIKQDLEAHGYSCLMDAPENRSFSYYYNGMNESDEATLRQKLRTPFIATFESCKGLEFDIVIMPFFELSDVATAGVNDRGRAWATSSHYYVAVTRAKNDIFILSSSRPISLAFHNEEDQQNIMDDLF